MSEIQTTASVGRGLIFEAAHDGEYRRAWKDWISFVERTTETIIEADETIPELPAKDLIFRIYRDIRFSKNPTPYKVRQIHASNLLNGKKLTTARLTSPPHGPERVAKAHMHATTSTLNPSRASSAAASGAPKHPTSTNCAPALTSARNVGGACSTIRTFRGLSCQL